MNVKIIEQLKQSILYIDTQYYKQIYVYEYIKGNSVKAFSEEMSLSIINVNLELAKLLKDIPEKRRIYKIPDLLSEIINSFSPQIVCLDYFELLFEPSLKLNPFELFKNISRNKTLIIAWRGKIDKTHFIHAEPGHPEFKKFQIDGTFVIQ